MTFACAPHAVVAPRPAAGAQCPDGKRSVCHAVKLKLVMFERDVPAMTSSTRLQSTCRALKFRRRQA